MNVGFVDRVLAERALDIGHVPHVSAKSPSHAQSVAGVALASVENCFFHAWYELMDEVRILAESAAGQQDPAPGMQGNKFTTSLRQNSLDATVHRFADQLTRRHVAQDLDPARGAPEPRQLAYDLGWIDGVRSRHRLPRRCPNPGTEDGALFAKPFERLELVGDISVDYARIIFMLPNFEEIASQKIRRIFDSSSSLKIRSGKREDSTAHSGRA